MANKLFGIQCTYSIQRFLLRNCKDFNDPIIIAWLNPIGIRIGNTVPQLHLVYIDRMQKKLAAFLVIQVYHFIQFAPNMQFKENW